MSPKLKMVAAVVVALVVVVGFYKLAIAPQSQRASALQGQIDKSEEKVKASQAQIRKLETLKASYPDDYTSLAGLGKAVPADDDVRSLLVQIDGAAKRSGVDFKSIALDGDSAASPTSTSTTGSASATQTAAATLPPGASVGAAGLPTMPFSFEFEGSFFTVSDFLARLERFVTTRGDRIDVRGRLLTIDGFSLTPSEKGFPYVTASLGATAYLVNPTEGSSGGATASGPASSTAPAAKGTATATPPLATVRSVP